MQTKSDRKKNEYSLEEIMRRVEAAAKHAKKISNPESIGHTTIVIDYNRSKISLPKTKNIINKRLKEKERN